MTRFKLLLIWAVCQLGALLTAMWMLLSIAAGSGRAWTIAVGYDQLANGAFGGSDDETISSRCWRYREDRRYAILVRIINFLAGNPNHCQEAFNSRNSGE